MRPISHHGLFNCNRVFILYLEWKFELIQPYFASLVYPWTDIRLYQRIDCDPSGDFIVQQGENGTVIKRMKYFIDWNTCSIIHHLVI